MTLVSTAVFSQSDLHDRRYGRDVLCDVAAIVGLARTHCAYLTIVTAALGADMDF